MNHEWLAEVVMYGAWEIAGNAGLILLKLALTVASTLDNPYGVGLWEFLISTVRLNRPNINDWRPLPKSGPDVILPWIAAAGVDIVSLARATPTASGSQPHRPRTETCERACQQLDISLALSTVMLMCTWFPGRKDKAQPRPEWHQLYAGERSVVLSRANAIPLALPRLFGACFLGP